MAMYTIGTTSGPLPHLRLRPASQQRPLPRMWNSYSSSDCTQGETVSALQGRSMGGYLGVAEPWVVGMCQTPDLSWGMRGFQLVW